MSVHSTNDLLRIQIQCFSDNTGLLAEKAIESNKRPLEQTLEDSKREKKQKLTPLEPQHQLNPSIALKPFSTNNSMAFEGNETSIKNAKMFNHEELDKIKKLFEEKADYSRQEDYVKSLKTLIRQIKTTEQVDESIYQIANVFYTKSASFGEEFKGKRGHGSFYKNIAKFFCLLFIYTEGEKERYLDIASLYFSKWGSISEIRGISYHYWLAKRDIEKGYYLNAFRDITAGIQSIEKKELEINDREQISKTTLEKAKFAALRNKVEQIESEKANGVRMKARIPNKRRRASKTRYFFSQRFR